SNAEDAEKRESNPPESLPCLPLHLGVLCVKKRTAGARPAVYPRGTNLYFLGAMTSFTAFATRNFTTVLAGILIGSPVCGLRPMRALRFDFTRRPSPGITNTPFFLVSLMAVSLRFSRNAAAVLLLVSSCSAKWRTSWVFVMPAAMNPPSDFEFEFDSDGPVISRFLCKTTISTAFYAVFLMVCVENALKMRLPRPSAAFVYQIRNDRSNPAGGSQSEKILNQVFTFAGEHTFRMELHAFHRMPPMPQSHNHFGPI